MRPYSDDDSPRPGCPCCHIKRFTHFGKSTRKHRAVPMGILAGQRAGKKAMRRLARQEIEAQLLDPNTITLEDEIEVEILDSSIEDDFYDALYEEMLNDERYFSQSKE